MNENSIFQLLFLILTCIQVWQGFRKPIPKQVGKRGLPSSPGIQFTLSKKRLFGLIFTAILFLCFWGWSVIFPRGRYKQIPKDQLTLVDGQQFLDEIVEVDGKNFQNCKFVGVTFRLKGEHNFSLEHSIIDGPTKLSFGSMAGVQASDAVVNLLLQANMISNGRVGFLNLHGEHDDVVIIPNAKAKAK